MMQLVVLVSFFSVAMAHLAAIPLVPRVMLEDGSVVDRSWLEARDMAPRADPNCCDNNFHLPCNCPPCLSGNCNVCFPLLLFGQCW